MTMFIPFPKMPRLNRRCVITEKIDGTNASVCIESDTMEEADSRIGGNWLAHHGDFYIAAGSRNRWISPDDDNYGFARWVKEHVDELITLGPGHHFGEWWGAGINRGYDLKEKRFSLFNRARWADVRPACCDVVPIIFEGAFTTSNVELAMDVLRVSGSHAAPGFMNPEGIVVYHSAANQLLKVTYEGDEEGKSYTPPKKEKAPRPPRDPSKGGRRIGQAHIDFPDRRKAA